MLIKKYEDLIEGHSEDDFAYIVAEFIMKELNLNQKIILRFNDQKYLEDFFEKGNNGDITDSEECQKKARRKSRAERTIEILQKESPKRGYHVEPIFCGHDYIVYERFTIQ